MRNGGCGSGKSQKLDREKSNQKLPAQRKIPEQPNGRVGQLIKIGRGTGAVPWPFWYSVAEKAMREGYAVQMAAYAVSLSSSPLFLYILYKSNKERGNFFEKGIDSEYDSDPACSVIRFFTVRMQHGDWYG